LLIPGLGGGDIPGMSGYGTPEEQALLMAIRYAEGTTKSYGTIFGGAVIPELQDGKMTVKEVIDMGNNGRLPARFGGRNAGYGPGSSATGAYQFMPFTLQGLVDAGVLNPSDLFTNQLQDKAALELARRRGVTQESLKREGLSANVADKLAPEWASFPTLSGRSFYGQSFKPLSVIQQKYKESLEFANTPAIVGSGSITLEQLIPIAASMGLQMTSHIRTGNPKSFHYSGEAMDFSNTSQYGPPTPQMLKFAQFVAQKYGSSLAELYYTPLGFGIRNGRRISLAEVGESVNRTHYDHVHVAIRKGTRPLTPPQKLMPDISGLSSPWPVDLEKQERRRTPEPIKNMFKDIMRTLEQQSNLNTKPNFISNSIRPENLISSISKEEDSSSTQILIQPVLT
jgi:hypothetical protein